MKTLGFKLSILISMSCLTAFGCSRSAGNASAIPATTNSANSIAAADNTSASGTKRAYPQEVVDEFMKSCLGAGSSDKLCTCLFDEIQKKYSLEEFTVIELKLSSGDSPDEFVEFAGRTKAQCMK